MKPRALALVALATIALVWGCNWVLMKTAVLYASPFVFAAERSLGGGILLLGLAAVQRKPLWPERPLGYLLLGVFQIAGFLGLVTWAIVTAGAGKIAMLSYTMPFWVALLAWPLLGDRLRLVPGIAVAIAVAGVALMIGPLHGAWIADVIAVLAGVSWAIGVIIAKRLQRGADLDLYNMTTWQLIFGGIVLAIVAAALPSRATVWSPAYVAILAYNVVFATAIAYVLWIFILRVLPAREASMGTLASPLLAVAWAWVLLGERPSLLEGSGMFLVAAGMLLLSFWDRLRLPRIATRERECVADDEQTG